MEDSLHERGHAMEDLFFAKSDYQLLENLRAEMAAKEACDALAIASRIKDPDVLTALVASGITPGSLASLALIPLVVVAWADGKMEDSEKSAILKSAHSAGIETGSFGYQTLESWLSSAPSSDLLECWKTYVSGLKESIDGPSFSQVKASVLDRAEFVAESAGGFLGVIPKISVAERKVLDELAAAFD